MRGRRVGRVACVSVAAIVAGGCAPALQAPPAPRMTEREDAWLYAHCAFRSVARTTDPVAEARRAGANVTELLYADGDRFDVALFACASPPAWATVEAPVESLEPTRAVLVHIDAPETALLQRATGGDETGDEAWRTVCTAPCDRRVRVDGRYRVLRSITAMPAELALPPADEDERIVVTFRPASRAVAFVGLSALLVGSIGTGLETFLLQSPVTVLEGTLAVAAPVLLVTGGVLLFTNFSSVKVRIEPRR